MRLPALCLILACCTLGSVSGATTQHNTSIATIERGFEQIPDSVDLAVYWYWVSDNVSTQGVIKDLESMKEQGITRAFISHIYFANIELGTTKFFSEGWWEAMHAALKRAGELDIEIGIFNSPGWSQSGGPWVEEEQSMRYLSLSQSEVVGGEQIRLPIDITSSPEVSAIAYPAPSYGGAPDKSASFRKEAGEEITITQDVESSNPFQTLLIETEDKLLTSAELLAEVGGELQKIQDITIDRSNHSLNVGFNPLAPVVVALPNVEATRYELHFAKGGEGDVKLTWSSVPQVESYPEKSLAKMFQRPLPSHDSYLWREQPEVAADVCVDSETVIDLTQYINDGEIIWEAPEGDWVVMTTSMKSTQVTNTPASPESRGLEIDKMSREHIRSHFDSYIGEIMRRIPEEDRRTFKVVVMDSYETGGLNWTDDMVAQFESTYGYNPTPYIPTLAGVVVDSRDRSDRFLWDLRRLIADRVSYDYVGGLRDVSNENGLTIWLENYGHWGFPGEFLQYGGQSDEVAGEFWSTGSLGNIENRAASSCCHIYGKQKVWAESCTVGRGNAYKLHPNLMKQRIDRFFTEGINATLLHLYIHQMDDDQYPGINEWFGNEFNRKNTWFSQLNHFGDYLKRSNFLLQQGQYRADVAYFIGEDAPKMTGVCDPALPEGYSFDYINGEILMTQARVEEGELALDSGMRYRVLVLPRQITMRPELLERLVEFAQNGLRIVGTLPQRSPSMESYPTADGRVAELSAQLAESEGYNATNSLESLFAEMGLKPDFSYVSTSSEGEGEGELKYIHRTLADGEIYFISNQREDSISFDATFRDGDGVAELWYAASGEQLAIEPILRSGSEATLAMNLAPLESVFVIFREDISKSSLAEISELSPIMTLDEPWQVSFKDMVSGEVYTTEMEELVDWIESDDEAIKHFSGEATYTTTFNLKKRSKTALYIDFESIMVMGEVTLNGVCVGGLWTPPYRLEVTPYLRKGENTLEVKVVNNWHNRLLHEQSLPLEDRLLRSYFELDYNGATPLPSGVIGSVELLSGR